MEKGRAVAGGSVIVRRLIYARTAITLLLGRIPTAVPVPPARMQALFTDVHIPCPLVCLLSFQTSPY